MNNSKFPEQIHNFIDKHHVMSLSVRKDSETWSASCYYAYDPEQVRLIFVSEFSTIHSQCILRNKHVSGTISNNEKNVFLIQGIQFSGRALQSDSIYRKKARKIYNKKFPFAILKNIPVWFIDLNYIKMTDNTVFFSAKSYWKRDE